MIRSKPAAPHRGARVVAPLALTFALPLLVAATGAHAQGAAQPFPSKPVRILVGSAAGGGTDIISRLLAQKLSEMWGQQVVVENRTGASATIAADFVAKSPPDGYNVVMAVPNSHTIGPAVMKLPYDVTRDFTPITIAATVPHVLVVGLGIPATSLAELTAMSRQSPGRLNFSSSGNGSTQHLAGEMFNMLAGLKNVHVPYKGSADAMRDLVAGQITFSFDTSASSIGQIRGGKLRPLAVTTTTRSSALPDVPTMAEAGLPGYEIQTWYGLFGPANLPRPVLDRWHQDVAKAIALPDVRERLQQLAAEPGGMPPEAFGAYIRTELARMAKLVKDAQVRSE
jgi:tripartite-type tricarboxylate transporter receptor subunit TctC